MNLMLINMLESAVTLTIFYIIYKLFLSKETFFKLNRIYLISSLMFSVTIPFVNLGMNFLPELNSGGEVIHKLANIKQGYNELNEIVFYAYKGENIGDVIVNYLGVGYFIGVAISLIFFVLGFVRVLLLIKKSTPKSYGRYRIVESSEILVPFSLFRWIIINPEKYSSDDMEQIIAHERMHAFQLHSIDLIIIEVLVILFWFNPFIYWYRKSIREVHEYLADYAVVENGCDRVGYQKLLLYQCTGSRYIGLTSRFSYSLSKNRLKMLTMMKSKSISKIKIVLAVPVIIVTVYLFTNPVQLVKANDNTKTSNELVIQQDTIKNVKGDVFYEVEDMPKFNGQEADAFRTYITQNLKYPEEAHKNNEQGRVFVFFVVNKKGNVQDVKVVRGVSPLLDKEAIRVVKSSPKWEPGMQNGKKVDVGYTFPIVFKLK